MRVPVTEAQNPLNLYGPEKPSETSLAMAAATMKQLTDSKQKRNAISSPGTPGPGPTKGNRRRSNPSA